MRVSVTKRADRLYYKLVDSFNRDLFEEAFINIYERRNNYIFLDYLNLSELPCEENIDFRLDDTIELSFSDERVDYIVKLAKDRTSLLMTDKMDPNNTFSSSLHTIISDFSSLESFLRALYQSIVEPRYSFACEDRNSELIDSHHNHKSEGGYDSIDHFNEGSTLASDLVDINIHNKIREYGMDEIKGLVKKRINGYRIQVLMSIIMIIIFIIIFTFSGVLFESLGISILVIFLIAAALLATLATAINEVAVRKRILRKIKEDNNTITITGKPSRVKISTFKSNKLESYIDMLRLTINGEECIIIPTSEVSLRANGGSNELIKRLKDMTLELQVFNESRVVDLSKGRINEIVKELDREI